VQGNPLPPPSGDLSINTGQIPPIRIDEMREVR
jgi:hypothetical protein